MVVPAAVLAVDDPARGTGDAAMEPARAVGLEVSIVSLGLEADSSIAGSLSSGLVPGPASR